MLTNRSRDNQSKENNYPLMLVPVLFPSSVLQESNTVDEERCGDATDLLSVCSISSMPELNGSSSKCRYRKLPERCNYN